MTFSLTEMRIAKASCLYNEKSCQLQAPFVWRIKMLRSSLVLYFFLLPCLVVIAWDVHVMPPCGYIKKNLT